MNLYSHKAPRSRNQGVVLLFVMGMLLLISILVMQYVDLGLREIHRRGRYAHEGEFRVEAMNLLVLSLAVIQECKVVPIHKGVFSPSQGWIDPIIYAQYEPPEGWEAQVRVYDESAKLALSAKTKPNVLQALFRQMGFETSIAAMLADNLIDWMDTDDRARLNGSESEYYLRQPIPYRASDAPLRSFRELYYVNGFRERFFDAEGQPNEAYHAFVDSVSFRWTGTTVNLNSASDLLLKTFEELYGLNYDMMRAKLDGPDGIRLTSDDRYMRNLNEAGIMSEPSGRPINFLAGFFRIEILLRHGEAAYRLTAFVDRPPTLKPRNAKAKKKPAQDAFAEIMLYWGGVDD